MHTFALLLFVLSLQLVINNLAPQVPEIVEQQDNGILYIDQLPSSINYASEGKGSSTIDGYNESIEARVARTNKSYEVYRSSRCKEGKGYTTEASITKGFKHT